MSDEIITAVAAEKSEKKEAPKQTREEKRLEKLMMLKEKYEKAAVVKEAAEKKADSIHAQIAKIEKEIQTEEIAEITRLCGEKNISYKDTALILQNIPDGKNADYVVKLLNERSNVI